jgi:hypothetical protein
MADDEVSLFESFLRTASSYVEFGCGGSTVLAVNHVSDSVISTDSSQERLDRVAAECRGVAGRLQPKLVLADIGPTGDWGRPIDDSCRDRWPTYARRIWQEEGAADADLFLVDGRFRVACFLEILARCRSDALVMIHDFSVRREYFAVREFAREVAVASDLSVFVRRPSIDDRRLKEVLERHIYHPG